MRPATTRSLDVANGWAALGVLREQIAQDDPKDLIPLSRQRRQSPAEIHAFVKSRVRYVHGTVQRWATPLRTLTAGFGDCGNSSRAIMSLAALNGYPSRLRVFTRTDKEPGILGRSVTSPAHVSAQIGDPGTGKWEWAEAAIDADYGEHTLAAARRLRVPTTIRELPLASPPRVTSGVWPWKTYPPRVAVGGRTFQKTPWAWPYVGVVAQYREMISRGSLHMMVRRGGSWTIDHQDSVNPDMGSAVEHLTRDVLPKRRALAYGGPVGIVGDVPAQVPATRTPVSLADMYAAMTQRWMARVGLMPTQGQIFVLEAQWALETGNGQSMIQWNIGNVKHVAGDGHDWVTYQTSECDAQGQNCTPQSGSFKAYDSLADGLDAYFDLFLGGRYAPCWAAVLAEDPDAFASSLRSLGYYTASEASYAAGLKARISQLEALDLPGPSLPLAQLPNLVAFMLLLGAGVWGAAHYGYIDVPPLAWGKLAALLP